ncbi:hypothetical protein D3C71_1571340 [compost metagenome]
MPPGAEADRHVPFAQLIPGAHDVVDALDLMVDVLHARIRGREQRDLVMDLVDAQQRRLADAVADPGRQQARPEGLVAARIQRTQADMRKPGHAGIAAGKIAPAAVLRRVHQLDAVAGRVREAQEVAHIALLGVLAAARVDLVAAALQHRAGALKLFRRIHLERGGVIAGVAFEVAKGVIARVGLEIGRPMFLAGQLQSQHRGRIAHRRIQITGAQPDIPDVM